MNDEEDSPAIYRLRVLVGRGYVPQYSGNAILNSVFLDHPGKKARKMAADSLILYGDGLLVSVDQSRPSALRVRPIDTESFDAFVNSVALPRWWEVPVVVPSVTQSLLFLAVVVTFAIPVALLTWVGNMALTWLTS
jgi:hypothetical protein